MRVAIYETGGRIVAVREFSGDPADHIPAGEAWVETSEEPDADSYYVSGGAVLQRPLAAVTIPATASLRQAVDVTAPVGSTIQYGGEAIVTTVNPCRVRER
ncbi:MAG: hypothetical protein AAFX94_18695 [Myxococcota bacterium]